MSTSHEEYRPEGDESPDTGTTYNHTTGEPERTPHDAELEAEETEASNPNAASSAGLAGDMGISSERTGPADETGTSGLGELGDFETRTVGTAKGRTHGTGPTVTDVPDHAEGHEAPGRDAEDDLAAHPDDNAVPKRTVGESNTAEVPSHKLGNKNPGHSSGGSPQLDR